MSDIAQQQDVDTIPAGHIRCDCGQLVQLPELDNVLGKCERCGKNYIRSAQPVLTAQIGDERS